MVLLALLVKNLQCLISVSCEKVTCRTPDRKRTDNFLVWYVLDKYGMTLQGLVFFGMHVKLKYKISPLNLGVGGGNPN